MRFYRLIVLAVLATAAATGCSSAGTTAIDTADLEPTPFAEMTEATLTPPADSAGSLILIAAGSEVPLKMKVEAGVAVGEFGENRLRFARDVYLLVRAGEIWISADRAEWAPIQEPSAWRDLIGMTANSFSFGLGVTQTDGPHAALTVQPAE